MAELHYEILTDPGELRVSGTGANEESPGAVGSDDGRLRGGHVLRDHRGPG